MLEDYQSHCEQNQRRIVSQDGTICCHIANNESGCNVRQYYIDSEVLKSENCERCDRLVLNDDKHTAYYIELKGSNVEKAIRQVENTERALRNELKEYCSFYRIV